MKALLLHFLAFYFTFAAHAKEAAVPSLTFALLGKAVPKEGAAPRFPEALLRMDGKKIRVTGYVCPYDQHALMLQNFVLTPEENQGCYSCNPPEANAVIFVRLPPKSPMRWKSAKVTVEGTLRLKGRFKADKDAAQFLATVEKTTVVAYK